MRRRRQKRRSLSAAFRWVLLCSAPLLVALVLLWPQRPRPPLLRKQYPKADDGTPPNPSFALRSSPLPVPLFPAAAPQQHDSQRVQGRRQAVLPQGERRRHARQRRRVPAQLGHAAVVALQARAHPHDARGAPGSGALCWFGVETGVGMGWESSSRGWQGMRSGRQIGRRRRGCRAQTKHNQFKHPKRHQNKHNSSTKHKTTNTKKPRSPRTGASTRRCTLPAPPPSTTSATASSRAKGARSSAWCESGLFLLFLLLLLLLPLLLLLLLLLYFFACAFLLARFFVGACILTGRRCFGTPLFARHDASLLPPISDITPSCPSPSHLSTPPSPSLFSSSPSPSPPPPSHPTRRIIIITLSPGREVQAALVGLPPPGAHVPALRVGGHPPQRAPVQGVRQRPAALLRRRGAGPLARAGAEGLCA